ncbi:ATP-dependent helicase HrpB [Azospirillum rugosum]|uniref:ATP-dependent helicase HrpB n=1 Tax=Azospirillum rugosum TaxID=416170 RepID=A0ABS4SS57_9PROT|nr:ATP-dependent helicase HrpB [Azospirillum rugosum]MBP2295396.1 ATP-dependent helicase HrpB [Azospirillum rugosum]MDQ0528771.1 ATP-dependent helicase HrpB [Azospirillum rugosum]
MSFPPLPALPIDPVLPDLLAALRQRGVAVLQAPPGAGKTTRVPLALLDQPWLKGRKVIVLEPRRLAARAAARRMAAMLGESVGETVGYRVRLDTKVGPRTRIEVVTDGLFLRQLQEDAELPAVGAVLFDEFHERGIDSDLALALVQEARGALRDDLRLVVMSATLDGAPVAALLDDAPMVTSEGRAFPVETRHLDAPGPGTRIEDAVAATVRRALREESGNALVFLPGAGEIRRVQTLLEGADPHSGLGPGTIIAPLYGDLTADAQDRAIAPSPPGTRKVVLATPIAETSLTIEGIRIVVDGGLMRVPRFDPRSGMTRLVTAKVSQASAEQRRGRAGRLEPGVCYRLWPEATHKALAPFTAPEILEADLAPLALELAVWGVADPTTLAWLDPPPAASMAQARELLRELGALNADGAITPHGRRMAGFGVHPRLAHMMLRGKELGLGGLACEVAALLGERDIVRAQPGFRDADLRLRVELLRGLDDEGRIRGAGRGLTVERGGAQQALKQARQWKRQLGAKDDGGDLGATGLLVALAYPDRIGQRRPGGNNAGGAAAQYRLSNGRGAYFQDAEPLTAQDWLAVADLDGAARESRVFLAAPVTLAELEDTFAEHIRTETVVTWDGREQVVLARRRRMLFALVLKDERLANPPAETMAAAMLEGIREMGLTALPWTDELRKWQARVQFLRRMEGEEWPDVSDAALLATLEDWLAPFLNGASRRAHLDRVELGNALRGLLPWAMQQRLDKEAPTHVEVPSGSRVPIDYAADEPVLAVRLQEMFGLAETPRIAGGRVALLLHLLSPARRPVQVTRDLASFWANAYKAVKADLKGQYPKHYWPDNPLEAEPTARAKPRGR